jgi:arsenate reductase
LTAKGIEFESIDYVRGQQLSESQLKDILRAAELRPHDVLRTKEPAYREHVEGRNLTDEQLLRVMAKHPELIQRPIVVRGNKAVLARPVENLAKLGIK